MANEIYSRGLDRVAAINDDIQKTGGMGGGAVTSSGIISSDGGLPTAKFQAALPKTTFDASTLSNPGKTTLPGDPVGNNLTDGIIGRSENIQKEAETQAAETVKREQAMAGVGAAQKEKESLYGDIKNLFNKKADIQSGIQDSPENQQLQAANKDLTGLNTEIADQNVKYRAELDAATGDASIGEAGVAAKTENVKAKYGRTLADLAIRQSAASGNVTRLQSALKDSLDLKLAPIDTDIKWFTDYALKNADDMSKQEQDQLKAIIEEKTRQKKEVTDKEEIANTALKSAAENNVKIPDNIVKEIMSQPGQAFQILAHYGVSLANPLKAQLDQANIDKIKSEADKNRNENAAAGLTVSGKPMNAEQAKANGYATRIAETNTIFDGIGDQFAGLGGLVLQHSPNFLQSPERQQFEQAKRNFVNAVLRRESGAAISAGEFDSANQQYFPQPGDSEEVLKQKKQNRETTLNNIQIESGRVAPSQTAPALAAASETDTAVADYIKSLKLK